MVLAEPAGVKIEAAQEILEVDGSASALSNASRHVQTMLADTLHRLDCRAPALLLEELGAISVADAGRDSRSLRGGPDRPPLTNAPWRGRPTAW